MVAQSTGDDGPLTRRLATGGATTPDEIEAAIQGFIADHQLTPSYMGVAVPGLVEDGRVTVCDVLPKLNGWQGPAANGLPYILVNDIRSALAEEAAGLAESPTVAVLLCGTAVGSAYLHQGRVVRGCRGWAGEIGYMPVPTPQGVLRLDELAGGAAIVRATGLSPAQVHAALAAGDTTVREIVDAAGEALGLAIATLVNILNPDTLRAAGGTLGYAGYWDAALATARTHSLPEVWDSCAVDRIKDPELVVARGALRLAAAAADGATWVRQYV
ncbi:MULTISPECIES: ROK family protein [unclassified Streptomyces]|uniref:ROK family protein n=1 Tax=unclassified Streptomyces TaxID=2593676 RepID=UPI001BEC8657|nr:MULTISPECIES: ROK family protein [unclassified Streptomyces]MBT2405868.1 ROK family protein [Streptomyces sp. ISL-21]MBT2613033.1 ROK family protein [Streptomyces sp. ISL-87]